MPRLSAWMVRASLIYFLAGLALGALMLAQKGVPFWAAAWTFFPMHVEFLLLGWLVQFAMGVAFWILPRFANVHPRGDERPVWAAFVLLNAGIVLVAAGLALPAGRTLEAVAVLLFVFGNWRRVKPHGA